MVFHDAGLERMVGRQGQLSDHTAAELSAMRLRGSTEPVPTLKQVFDLIDGRALIHVELKTRPGEEGPLDQAVAALLDDYRGPVAIIGFNPYSHAWWATHRPEVLRGLDSYRYEDEAGLRLPDEMRRSLQALEHVAIARPHFLALSADMLEREPAVQARQGGFPIVAWTIRSDAQAAAVAPFCDNLIFEGFRP
jgi:glycerophosphoryl diester phosphodiesterase